jgi:hypothetical protein
MRVKHWAATVAIGLAAATSFGMGVRSASALATLSNPTPGAHLAEVTQSAGHDTSPPLRQIHPSEQSGTGHPAKHHGGDSRQTASSNTSGHAATPRIPSTNASFNGISANGSAPPDNEGAAGPTQYVELVNTELAVYTKTGSLLLGPEATNTLWSGFNGACQTNNDGDGTVLFDTIAQRWVIQQFSITGGPPYFECVAVSTTSDATGTWHRYSFQYANFPDYPKMGVWPDAYYVSLNLFNASGTTGLGTEVCAFDRTSMLNGAAATQQCIMATTSGEHTLLPATLDGTTQPPAGEAEWFVGLSPNGGNALGYYRFHTDWSTPGNTTLSAETDLPVNAFSQACGGGTCIRQSGTSTQLDSLGDRLMFRLAYRNFGDHEALVVNHSVTAGSSVGLRWYELRPNGTSLNVFQQGTYAPDSNYRWMGSIAMDRSGDMALGFSVSSSSTHPGIRYTGRLAGDAAGTMPQGEATIITGGGSQNASLTRWGDYSEMSVDPSDDCTFWYVNEYLPSNGSFNWRTRIASFKFSGCGGVVANDFSISANPSSVGVTRGSSVTTTINTTVISGSAQTVSLSATSGLPAGASASFNPTSVTAGGSSTMTISTSSSTPAGTYSVTVTGTGTSATHTTTVSLTVNNVVANDFSISASPSSVTVTQGGSGTTTISTAVTSGSAQTVALSASGLPSGASASFNPASVTAGGSSTMTITATSSATTGTTSVTVTGTGTPATHTTSVSLTVSAPSGGGGVVNGGFETGNFSGWSTSGFAPTIVTPGHTGSFAAQLGSTSPTSGDSTVQQTVAVPAAGGTLSFWYQPHCPDTLTYDQEQMQIRSTSNTVLATVLNVCSNSGAWTQATQDLGAWKGTSVILWFNNHDDNYPSDPTYTYFDDVAITAPQPPPPNVVVNGGFETGNFSGWTTSGQQETVVNSGAHSGSFAARLGGTSPTNGDSTMQQTVAVPSGSSTLSFWYQPHCPDTLTYDQQQMQIRSTSNTVLATVLNVCSNSGAWTQVTFSMNAYAGTSVVLWFNSHDDNYPSDPTYTLFDDINLH